jgi:hypothetical protein
MVEGRESFTAALAAYLNLAVEPTPDSLARSSLRLSAAPEA